MIYPTMNWRYDGPKTCQVIYLEKMEMAMATYSTMNWRYYYIPIITYPSLITPFWLSFNKICTKIYKSSWWYIQQMSYRYDCLSTKRTILKTLVKDYWECILFMFNWKTKMWKTNWNILYKHHEHCTNSTYMNERWLPSTYAKGNNKLKLKHFDLSLLSCNEITSTVHTHLVLTFKFLHVVKCQP